MVSMDAPGKMFMEIEVRHMPIFFPEMKNPGRKGLHPLKLTAGT